MLLCIASVVVSSGQGTQPHTHTGFGGRAGARARRTKQLGIGRDATRPAQLGTRTDPCSRSWLPAASAPLPMPPCG